VYAGLNEALGGRLGQETEREKLAGQRIEAMKAMKQAAEHLDLPLGKAPQGRTVQARGERGRTHYGLQGGS
jgi:hypothetical protein